VDKVQINQSGAIYRYLARELGEYVSIWYQDLNSRCPDVLDITICDNARKEGLVFPGTPITLTNKLTATV